MTNLILFLLAYAAFFLIFVWLPGYVWGKINGDI